MISAAHEKKTAAANIVIQNKENDFNLYSTYISVMLKKPGIQRKFLVISL